MGSAKKDHFVLSFGTFQALKCSKNPRFSHPNPSTKESNVRCSYVLTINGGALNCGIKWLIFYCVGLAIATPIPEGGGARIFQQV